ncbi:MAG: hypothetical protein AAGA54_12360 [Myxococcota bacterium]
MSLPSVLVGVALAIGGCYEGVLSDVEDEPRIALEDIRDVADLPALEGEAFLLELSRVSPPADQYEFIGFVRLEGEPLWVHDTPPEGSVGDVLAAAGIQMGDPLQGVELPPGLEDTDAARGILVSADGRLFVERLDAFEARLERIASMPESGMSGAESQGYVPPGLTVPRSAVIPPPKPAAAGIHGADQRTPVTTSDYPYRAAGVSILRPSGGSGSIFSNSRKWNSAGSAAMIGPRHATTAVHVFLSGGDLMVRGLGPAARGPTWPGADGTGPGPNYAANAQFPFGARRTVWYAWSTGYDGGPAYDYGMMVMQDLAWSPGHLRLGYQSTSWLDFRDGWYMFGYPNDSCANGYGGSSECGGFMYRIKGETRGVYPQTAIHWLDTASGQSGANLYIKNGNDRVVYLINHGECTQRDCGVAKRLRAGSYSNMCSVVNSFPSSFFDTVDCD